MELKPKLDWQELLDAHASQHVDVIVNFLMSMQKIDEYFFVDLLRFLRDYPDRFLQDFDQKLRALELIANLRSRGSDYARKPAIKNFFQAIKDIYAQDMTKLGNLRGAIVELLAKNLVCPRCSDGECSCNQCFVDDEYDYSGPGDYNSPQIDVAVLSRSARHIEGYSCKINTKYIKSADCKNLINLGRMKRYLTHVGVVSFENTDKMRQDLEILQLDISSIKLYGSNNITGLQTDPFK